MHKFIISLVVGYLFLISFCLGQKHSKLYSGSLINLQCRHQTTLNFQIMHTFMVVFKNAPSQTIVQLKSYNNNAKLQNAPQEKQCKLSKQKQICVFNNYTTKIWASCNEKQKSDFITLQIIEPIAFHELQQGESIQTRAIMPMIRSGERGLLVLQKQNSMNILQLNIQLSNEDSMPTMHKNYKSNGCIQLIEEYQNYIYVGIKRKDTEQCIIYLGESNQTIDKYLIEDNSQIQLQIGYPGFIIKNQKKSYKRQQLHSFSVHIKQQMVEIEKMCQQNRQRIILSFNLQNNSKIKTVQQLSEYKPRKIQYNLCQFINNTNNQNSLNQIFVKVNNYEELIIDSTTSLVYQIKFYTPQTIPILPKILIYQLQQSKQTSISFQYLLPLTFEKKKYHIQCTAKITRIQDISENQQKNAIIMLDNSNNLYINKTISQKKIMKLRISVQTSSTFLFYIFPLVNSLALKIGKNENFAILPEQTKIFQIGGSQMSKISVDKLLIRLDPINARRPFLQIQFFVTYNSSCYRVTCCEYSSNDYILKIPNNKKLLRIIIISNEKSEQIPCNLLIEELNQYSYILQAGIINKLKINQNNPLEHYTFTSDSAKMSLACNSNSNSLILMINTKKKTFPTFTDFEYQSNNCYLNFKSVIGSKVYLTIYYDKYQPSQNRYTNTAVLFDLVITSIVYPIRLIWNAPFYDYIDSQTERAYKISIQTEHNNNTYLKFQQFSDDKLMNVSLVVMQQSLLKSKSNKIELQKWRLQHHKQIYFQANQNIFQVINLQTIVNNLCQNKKYCSLLAVIYNENKVKGYFLSATIWYEKQVFSLQLGNFFSSQIFYPLSTQQLNSNQRDLHFFCKINSKLKTHVFIQGFGFVFDISYVILPSISSELDLLKLLRHGQAFPKISINRIFPESYKNFCIDGSQKFTETLILITLRPITNTSSLRNKSMFYHLKILCTQQETRMLPGNLFLRLSNSEVHKFNIQKIKYQPKSYVNYFINLYSSNHANQLSLHLAAYQGQIQVLVYIANNHNIIANKTISVQKSLVNSSSLFNFYQLIQQYANKKQINKQTNTIKQNSQLMLTASIKCVSYNCSLLSTLLSSTTIYKEILPGIQSIFHMKKHSIAIYAFQNFKDLPFKIKINRKEGFPSYRLCSTHFQTIQNCLNQFSQNKGPQSLFLQLDDENDQLFQITGRSHELQINYSSKKYCSSCLYFIGLYSKYDELQGSVFILQQGSPIKLPQGTTITTIVYRGSPDFYQLYTIQDISLFQQEGYVKVTLIDAHSKQVVKQFQNSTSLMIELTSIESLCFNTKIKCILKIEPSQIFASCLYSIAVTQLSDKIYRLADGVPLSFNDTKSIKRRFIFHPETLGNILITTNNGLITNLIIELSCVQIQTSKSNLKSILQKFTGREISKGNYSLLGNRYEVPINVPPSICSDYQVTIINLNHMDYAIIGQSADFVVLILGQQVLGLLQYQEKLYQIYEIMITQQKSLRFNINFCQSSSGRIMIADSKKSMLEQNYVFSMQISQQTQKQQFQYTASPGVLYLTVYFKDRSGVIQYSLKVDDQKDIIQYTSMLANPYLEYETISINDNQTKFQVLFYPCEIIQPKMQTQEYSVSYYILQSFKPQTLSKISSCNGKHFTELFKRNQLIGKPIKIHTINYPNSNKNMSAIKANFTTNYPYSYVSIIPVIRPNNLYFTHIPKYMPIQLKNGQVLAAFVAELNRIIYLLKQYFQQYNISQNTILIVIIGLLAMIVASMCCLIFLLRKRFCPRTQTVYVMKQVSSQQLPVQAYSQQSPVQAQQINQSGQNE